MKIINVIIIDGEEVNFDELSEEKQKEISQMLNKKALNSIGYREVEAN